MIAKCQVCERELRHGELAWADDWKLWDDLRSIWLRETRYTCNERGDRA